MKLCRVPLHELLYGGDGYDHRTLTSPLSRLKLVPARRLEDKIRHLCALAAVASDDDAWLYLSELRILITQHVEHLRMVAAGKLSGTREFAERRDSAP